MSNNQPSFSQIKNNILNDLKDLCLDNKDRQFLWILIDLWDFLVEKENDKFINRLQTLIEDCDKNDDKILKEKFNTLSSLLDHQKYLEIRHLRYFSMYIEQHKITIYPKRLPVLWDILIFEIKKFKFKTINVVVYNSLKTNEKIINKEFKLNNKKIINKELTSETWENELIKILNDNVLLNIVISVFLPKEKLIGVKREKAVISGENTSVK